MGLNNPIEVNLEKEHFKRRLAEIYEILGGTGKEAKLRLITELAEDLSKHYHVDLKIRDMKDGEIITKKISVNLAPTPDIIKWLDFT